MYNEHIILKNCLLVFISYLGEISEMQAAEKPRILISQCVIASLTKLAF